MVDNKNASEIRSNQELINFINHGNSVKYMFFWGHHTAKNQHVDKSCFSQWHMSGFEIDNVYYKTAEHFMMAKKAELFSDSFNVKNVLKSEHPAEAKKIGRNVKGFKEEVWLKNRFNLVVEGNLAKFSQNEELKAFLLATKSRVLVEASPVDDIWGIGLASDDKKVSDPYKWKGLNLLGYSLMEVREKLLNS